MEQFGYATICKGIALLRVERRNMEDFKKNVLHPTHYNKEGRRECWDEMIDIFGIGAAIDFDILSAYKYFYRAGLKDGNPVQQDIAKINCYINHARMLIDKDSENHAFSSCIMAHITRGREKKLNDLIKVLKEGGIDIE